MGIGIDNIIIYLPVVLNITNITHISGGSLHCFFLNNIGEVYSFGGNNVINLNKQSTEK
jgi:alpha-tubulin suppressor-like RCC1 family protein